MTCENAVGPHVCFAPQLRGLCGAAYAGGRRGDATFRAARASPLTSRRRALRRVARSLGRARHGAAVPGPHGPPDQGAGVIDGRQAWPGAMIEKAWLDFSALALRMMAAVHRLVLTGERRRWRGARRRRRRPRRTWEAFRATLEDRVDELRPLVDRPVQTNEVGRCAALLPGFLEVAARTGMPLRLLEVGASAGLNLRLERVPLRGGGFAWGPGRLAAADRVRAPRRRDPAGPGDGRRAGAAATPRRSTPRSEEGRLTLLSYAWPDQAGADGAAARRARDRRRAPGRRSSAAGRWSGRGAARRAGARPRDDPLPLDRHAVPVRGRARRLRRGSSWRRAHGPGEDAPAGLAADGARRRTRRHPARDAARATPSGGRWTPGREERPR